MLCNNKKFWWISLTWLLHKRKLKLEIFVYLQSEDDNGFKYNLMPTNRKLYEMKMYNTSSHK